MLAVKWVFIGGTPVSCSFTIIAKQTIEIDLSLNYSQGVNENTRPPLSFPVATTAIEFQTCPGQGPPWLAELRLVT